MPRIRRIDCSGPGITRRRRGKGFEYLDEEGRRVREDEVLVRIRELAIPPAWRDVWICPYPNGHLQAVGTDDAGRKQYLYHREWRRRRDQEKFDDMIEFARALPRLRRVCGEHLAREGVDRERVLACAIRLLDRGFFRVGGEDYAEQNQTYGLATMLKRHVLVDGNLIAFDYAAKGGKRRIESLVDPEVADLVAMLKRRRGGGEELLAYKRERRWVDIKSEDINQFLKEMMDGDFSAKDFRTWSATVLAAVAVAVTGEAASVTARKRAVTRAVKEVAHYLGNTPAVCRASYIDPRVFDRYRSGWTIHPALDALGDVSEIGDPATQGLIEEAVLDLIDDHKGSDAVGRVTAWARDLRSAS
jgi:DNA topoisomerase-1